MRSLAVIITCVGFGHAAAAGPDLATCFDDSDPGGKLGVWTYEGHSDWKSARAAIRKDYIPGELVFSFLPGRGEYAVAELGYCFYMQPGDPSKQFIRCRDGKLQISQIEEGAVLVGTYDFTLRNGQRRALSFRAPYCPKE